MPPLAAEFAVGDALQADRFLPGDHFADGALGIGADVRRAQQAADLVGAERRRHRPRYSKVVSQATSWRKPAVAGSIPALSALPTGDFPSTHARTIPPDRS